MKINFKRFFALLTLIFLLIAVFGTLLHETTPQSKHCCAECHANCTVCALRGTLSKALIFALAIVVIVLNADAIREKTRSITYAPTSRSFPMLC